MEHTINKSAEQYLLEIRKHDNTLTIFCWLFEAREMQKYANIADLVKSFPTNIYLRNLGVDIAENEPLEVWGKIKFSIHFTP